MLIKISNFFQIQVTNILKILYQTDKYNPFLQNMLYIQESNPLTHAPPFFQQKFIHFAHYYYYLPCLFYKNRKFFIPSISIDLNFFLFNVILYFSVIFSVCKLYILILFHGTRRKETLITKRPTTTSTTDYSFNCVLYPGVEFGELSKFYGFFVQHFHGKAQNLRGAGHAS